jgi:hypothetical protein
MATILARDDEIRPPLTGHLFICTGFPHQRTDKKGNSIDLFPSKLAHGSWEMYKNGPVASREMNDLYAGMGRQEMYPFDETNTKPVGQISPTATQLHPCSRL